MKTSTAQGLTTAVLLIVFYLLLLGLEAVTEPLTICDLVPRM